MQRINRLPLTRAALIALLGVCVVGLVSSAMTDNAGIEPDDSQQSTEVMAFLTGEPSLPSPSYCEPTADQSTVGYYGVVDKFTQDRVANRLYRERLERGWQRIVVDFKEPLSTDHAFWRETGLYSTTEDEKTLHSVVIDGSYTPVPGVDWVELTDDFANQAAAVLDGVLRRRPRLFVSERQRSRATEGLQVAIEQAIANGDIDLSRSSLARRQAILTSLRDLGDYHLGLDRYDDSRASPASLTSLHLQMHDKLKSLYWKVLMALERGDLQPGNAERQASQRQWMLDRVGRLPDDSMRRKPVVLESLRGYLRDPLIPAYDRPMTDAAFAWFQETLGTQPKPQAGDGLFSGPFTPYGNPTDKPTKTLSDGNRVVVDQLKIETVGFELLYRADSAHWRNQSRPAFNEDKISGHGGGGDSSSPHHDIRFASSPEVSYRRSLTDFSSGLSVVDIRVKVYEFVRKPSFVRDEENDA